MPLSGLYMAEISTQLLARAGLDITLVTPATALCRKQRDDGHGSTGQRNKEFEYIPQ
jgi:hypothetical protein